MIYGFLRDEAKTVIAAASDLDELASFIQDVSTDLPLCVSAEFASFEEVLFDPVFSKLKRTPLIVTHTDAAQRQSFIEKFNVKLLSEGMIVKRADEMMEAHRVRQSLADERPIGEIHGLYDPKSQMTEEQRAEAEYEEARAKEEYEQAKREGRLSEEQAAEQKSDSILGISRVNVKITPDGKVLVDAHVFKRDRHAFDGRDDFDPTKFDGSPYKFATVTTVNTAGHPLVYVQVKTINDGNVDEVNLGLIDDYFVDLEASIDGTGLYAFENCPSEAFIRGFLAEVGFKHDDALQQELEMKYKRIAEPDDAVVLDENGDNIAIARDSLVELYYKVLVRDWKLDEVRPLLEKDGIDFDKYVAKARDSVRGCWMACVLERFADRITKVLEEAGMVCERSKVDASGAQSSEDNLVELMQGLLTKNPVGMDRLIRPWNDRAQWDALTDEQKEENRKTWKGEEFYMCSTPFRDGKCLVAVVPRAWFDKHETTFDEPFDISHLFPDTLMMKPYERNGAVIPWRFTTTLQIGAVNRALCNGLNFTENLIFQTHLNMYGY